MLKILLFACVIFLYPVFRFRYKKAYLLIKQRLSRSRIFLLRIMGEKSGSYNSKRSKFLSDFSAIFHPRNGKFGDKELRKKVYDMLFPSLRKGTNYKSLYRKTAMALHPDTEANSECTKEELEFVFKYFQEHMTHPNEM